MHKVWIEAALNGPWSRALRMVREPAWQPNCGGRSGHCPRPSLKWPWKYACPSDIRMVWHEAWKAYL
jgi:hypothetical protein